MGLILKEKDFESFFQAPFEAYGEETLYVSPFKDDLKRFLSNKNPLFSKYGEFTFFTAFRDQKPVGRITAHIHHKSNQKFDTKTGYFGFFDCEDNLDTAKALLTACEAWLREKGMTEVKGNFNLTAMQQVGVMVDGFEKFPYIDQVYSPPHISKLLEALGYKADFPMTTFQLKVSQLNPESLMKDKQRQLLEDEDVKFHKINFFNTNTVLKKVMDVLNDGFKDNPMFVPLTWEEFIFQAKDMMWVMDPAISALVTYKGQPIGTVVCIPDLNPILKQVKSQMSFKTVTQFIKQKIKRDRAVIIFYSVAQQFHGKGLNPLMLHHVFSNLQKRGYQYCGMTWIADVNPASLRQIEKLGGEQMHKLVLYGKEI